MAEPRRIDDDEIIPTNVAERRRPARDIESHLLRDEPRRGAEPKAGPLSESSDVRYPATNSEAEDRRVATEPAPPARNEGGGTVERPILLFDDAEVKDYRSRWSSIQTAFVDEPRKAVVDADNLVNTVLNKLSESFTQQRQALAGRWERGDNASSDTEDLRITLQRYRSFFDRLLNV